jgi:hypothetical protein
MADRSKYERELRAQLADVRNWPTFVEDDFLERLNSIADRALRKRTTEGYLAAILIYHQLTEELIRLLLRDTQFLMRLALFPSQIEFTEKRKQTFGDVIQHLREGVRFPGRERILALAPTLNTIRIGVVHKLTRRGSLAGLAKEARAAKRLYERIFDIFDDAHDGFYLAFKDYRKDVFEIQ